VKIFFLVLCFVVVIITFFAQDDSDDVGNLRAFQQALDMQ